MDEQCKKCKLKYCSLCYSKCPRHGVGLQPNMDPGVWHYDSAIPGANHNDHKEKDK